MVELSFACLAFKCHIPETSHDAIADFWLARRHFYVGRKTMPALSREAFCMQE